MNSHGFSYRKLKQSIVIDFASVAAAAPAVPDDIVEAFRWPNDIAGMGPALKTASIREIRDGQIANTRLVAMTYHRTSTWVTRDARYELGYKLHYTSNSVDNLVGFFPALDLPLEPPPMTRLIEITREIQQAGHRTYWDMITNLRTKFTPAGNGVLAAYTLTYPLWRSV